VMEDARRIGAAVLAGQDPNPADTLRLAALGIRTRDAVLLSQMPVEFGARGKLILPAVDAWKGLGHDGRQAREALLTAIHAEARRTIITPSIGDRSTILNGVWTRRGQVAGQSDLMTIPMQFLSYGLGAHNKLLTAALQGRDRSTVLGIFYLIMGGLMANWLKTDKQTWRNKDYDQIIADAVDSAGIGGFWFGDLNRQIEKVSNNRFGVRPLLGIDPAFKRGDTEALISGLGSAPSHFWDLSRAFWDPSISASQRAQIIRKGIPYNNIVWWDALFDSMASGIGGAFEGKQ
jgi:hypothetical protein